MGEKKAKVHGRVVDNKLIDKGERRIVFLRQVLGNFSLCFSFAVFDKLAFSEPFT